MRFPGVLGGRNRREDEPALIIVGGKAGKELRGERKASSTRRLSEKHHLGSSTKRSSGKHSDRPRSRSRSRTRYDTDEEVEGRRRSRSRSHSKGHRSSHSRSGNKTSRSQSRPRNESRSRSKSRGKYDIVDDKRKTKAGKPGLRTDHKKASKDKIAKKPSKHSQKSLKKTSDKKKKHSDPPKSKRPTRKIIDHVPTVRSYNSDDSVEEMIEERSKYSRYSVDPVEDCISGIMSADESEFDDKYSRSVASSRLASPHSQFTAPSVDRLWSDSTDDAPQWRGSIDDDERDAPPMSTLKTSRRTQDLHVKTVMVDETDENDPVYASPRQSKSFDSKRDNASKSERKYDVTRRKKEIEAKKKHKKEELRRSPSMLNDDDSATSSLSDTLARSPLAQKTLAVDELASKKKKEKQTENQEREKNSEVVAEKSHKMVDTGVAAVAATTSESATSRNVKKSSGPAILRMFQGSQSKKDGMSQSIQASGSASIYKLFGRKQKQNSDDATRLNNDVLSTVQEDRTPRSVAEPVLTTQKSQEQTAEEQPDSSVLKTVSTLDTHTSIDRYASLVSASSSPRPLVELKEEGIDIDEVEMVSLIQIPTQEYYDSDTDEDNGQPKILDAKESLLDESPDLNQTANRSPPSVASMQGTYSTQPTISTRTTETQTEATALRPNLPRPHRKESRSSDETRAKRKSSNQTQRPSVTSPETKAPLKMDKGIIYSTSIASSKMKATQTASNSSKKSRQLRRSDSSLSSCTSMRSRELPDDKPKKRRSSIGSVKSAEPEPFMKRAARKLFTPRGQKPMSDGSVVSRGRERNRFKSPRSKQMETPITPASERSRSRSPKPKRTVLPQATKKDAIEADRSVASASVRSGKKSWFGKKTPRTPDPELVGAESLMTVESSEMDVVHKSSSFGSRIFRRNGSNAEKHGRTNAVSSSKKPKRRSVTKKTIEVHKPLPTELDEYSVGIEVTERHEEAALVQCLRFYSCGAIANAADTFIKYTDCNKKPLTSQVAADYDAVLADRDDDVDDGQPRTRDMIRAVEEGLAGKKHHKVKHLSKIKSSSNPDEDDSVIDQTKAPQIEEAPELYLPTTPSVVREVTSLRLHLDEESTDDDGKSGHGRRRSFTSKSTLEDMSITSISFQPSSPSSRGYTDEEKEDDDEADDVASEFTYTDYGDDETSSFVRSPRKKRGLVRRLNRMFQGKRKYHV